MTYMQVVFRCDMLLLVACVGLQLLLSKQVTMFKSVWVCVAAAVVSCAVSIPMDSWFWQQWLWPEGQVLWFNTVLNK